MIEAFMQEVAQTSGWEMLAAALGLAYLVLAVRRNLLCWLCALLSTGIYTLLFVQYALYMQSLLHLFYMLMAVYGYWQWRIGRTEADTLEIQRWPVRYLLPTVLIVVAGSAVNGWWLSHYTDAAAPYVDALVTWGSVVATWMVARRILENWPAWLIIDAIAVWLYASQGLYATALLFAVYLIIIVPGYLSWRRAWQLQQRANEAASV